MSQKQILVATIVVVALAASWKATPVRAPYLLEDQNSQQAVSVR